MLATAAAGGSPELHDMTRRFLIGTALALPVFALDMGSHLVNLAPCQQVSNWILLLLDGAFGRAMVEDRFDLQAYRSLVLGAIAAAVTPLPEPQPERPRPKRPRAA